MSILTFLTSLFSPSKRRREVHRLAVGQLQFESLEDRCVLTFDMPVDYGEGLSPYAVVSGDFNGDGQLDLATANRDDHSVSALLGNGDGTFQAAKTSSGDYFFDPTKLWAADLNGDGNDDLVTLNIGPNSLSLLIANGDGTFQPPQAIASLVGYPVSVAVNDFDGDGNVDLVAGGTTVDYDSYATVLLANGDSTFRLASVKYLPGGSAAAYLDAGDFNNDGRLDIVSVLGVFPGNGDGTFQDGVPGLLSVGGVGDFNGDGNLDVFSDPQGGPYLQLGNGDGTFRPGEYLGWIGFEQHTIAGDVNRDGNLDLVVVANDYILDEYGDPIATTRFAQALLSHGDGTFVLATSYFNTVPGVKQFESPLLADFDDDGFPDLAATQAEYDYGGTVFYSGVHVMINNPGSLPPPPPPPYVTIGDAIITEGNIGMTAATFTVTLSKSWDQPVSVAYAAADGMATAGNDFQAVSGTLTIPAGQTTGTIMVMVNGDRVAESNETFVVDLSSPTNATIVDDQGVGSIVDDEPRISISDVSKSEGRKNQTTLFTFTVTLSAAYDQLVTMSFRTMDSTARSGEDYAINAGTLTFAPGETTKTITIEVKGDNKREAHETFYVDLFGLSSNASFTKNRGIGTILNDD